MRTPLFVIDERPRLILMIIVFVTSETGDTVKVRNSLKSMKNQPGSQIVRRRGRTFVINKQNPRFKARQG